MCLAVEPDWRLWLRPEVLLLSMLHQWQQGRCRVLKIPVTSGDSPCVNKSNNDWMEMMMQICPAVEGKSRRLRIVLSHR